MRYWILELLCLLGICGNSSRWDINVLSRNLNLAFDFVERHPEGLNEKSWDMDALSSNTTLPWHIVENNPESFSRS